MTTENLDTVLDRADGRDQAPPFWVLGKCAQALAPRCRARNRLGEACGKPAQTGGEFCYWHTNATSLREARSRRKSVNPKQAHAKVMRALWRTDPWTPGFTCYLEPEALQRLVSWLDGHGVRYDWLAPMTQDWLAWKFVNLVRRKCLHEARATLSLPSCASATPVSLTRLPMDRPWT